MEQIDFKGLGDNLVSSVQKEFKALLDENPSIANFVGELGRRYATLSARYHLAASDAERDEAHKDLLRVENTIQLELDAMAHLAKPAILGQLKAALGVVFRFAVENLPTILAMVRR